MPRHWPLGRLTLFLSWHQIWISTKLNVINGCPQLDHLDIRTVNISISKCVSAMFLRWPTEISFRGFFFLYEGFLLLSKGFFSFWGFFFSLRFFFLSEGFFFFLRFFFLSDLFSFFPQKTWDSPNFYKESLVGRIVQFYISPHNVVNVVYRFISKFTCENYLMI